MEHLVLFPETDHILREFVKLFVLLKEPPVKPVNVVVLAVGIVIAESCLTALIT